MRYRLEMFCHGHRHPRHIQPIRARQFAREFVELARLAKIQETCEIDISERLAQEHERNARRYADVDPARLSFAFAPQVLWLPWEHRRGLIAHEIGHVLCRDLPDGGTEGDADHAAREILGVQIAYDGRWPGKGLQVATS